MKFKKLLAGVCAMSIAASMMAVSASAAIAKGTESYDITAAVKAAVGENKGLVIAEDIAGVKLTLTGADLNYYEKEDGTLVATIKDDGFGGGVMLNSSVAGWDQPDNSSWGNDGQANNVVVTVDGDTVIYTVTVMFEDGGYKALDDVDIYGEVVGKNDDGTDANGYAQICVQEWWGGDLSIEYTLLDADGNEVLDPDVMAAKKEAREKAAADAIANLKSDKALTIVEKLETAAAAISDIDNIMKEADDEIAALDKAIADAEAAIADLRECDTYDKDAYETAMEVAADDKAAIVAAQEKLQAAKDALDEKNAAEKKDLQDKIDALNKQIAELETDAATNADKIAALEAEKAELEKQLEDAKKNPPAAGGSEGGSEGGSQGSTSNGDNPGTGVTAGLTLAGLALAGAAVVASKKRK